MQRQQALSRDFCSFHEQSDASYRGIFSWLFGNNNTDNNFEKLEECKQKMVTLKEETKKCQSDMSIAAAKMDALKQEMEILEKANQQITEETDIPPWLTDAAERLNSPEQDQNTKKTQNRIGSSTALGRAKAYNARNRAFVQPI